ncbi:MAG: hypothetical protein CL859_08445, partial [Cyanobium sp. ARS6]|nr:hypothetical protein [Cyanobium sp. ARS6]
SELGEVALEVGEVEQRSALNGFGDLISAESPLPSPIAKLPFAEALPPIDWGNVQQLETEWMHRINVPY